MASMLLVTARRLGLVAVVAVIALAGSGCGAPTASSQRVAVTETPAPASAMPRTPVPFQPSPLVTPSPARPRTPEQADVLATMPNPRAIAVAQDGTIVVADAGKPTVPYSGQVVQIDQSGQRQPLIAGIGNLVGMPDGQPYLFGVSDVATFDGGVYFVLGLRAWLQAPLYGPSRLMRRTQTGAVEEVFDFYSVEGSQDPDGNGPDTNGTGVAVGPDGTLWVTDAAGNWVAHLSSDGQLLSVTAFPQSDGEDAVPTGVTVGADGSAYVTLFRCQDTSGGAGAVVRVNGDGTYDVVVAGLSNPIDVAFDDMGRLWILEFSIAGQPASGRISVLHGETLTPVIRGLVHPTALAIDPSGAVIVTSLVGADGRAAIDGSVLRWRVP